MNCIIIDDEPLAIKVIEKYLECVPDVNCRATFSDPLKALDYLSEQSVDLLFLDINMPDLTGLGLLKLLKQKVLVVFTTAYTEYAVESYEYQAVDYLLKPFGLDRFLQAIDKARERRPEEQLISIEKPSDLQTIFSIRSTGQMKRKIQLRGIVLSIPPLIFHARKNPANDLVSDRI